jgi:serine O-acetyltransferase
VVVRPVPAGATVVGVPGRIAESECPATGTDLNYANLPDPMLRVVSRLLDRQNRLEERLRSMQKALLGQEAERIDMVEISKMLPGYNCGECGHRQCKDYAEDFQPNSR